MNKKTLLSIATITMLLSVSASADVITESLTKSTVKLIKETTMMKANINKNDNAIQHNLSLIKNNGLNIGKNKDKINEIDSKLNNVMKDVEQNKKSINKSYDNSVKSLNKSTISLNIANTIKKDMDKMMALSEEIKDKVNKAELSSKEAINLKKDIILNKNKIADLDKILKTNVVNIKNLQDKVKKLENSFKNFKLKTNGEYTELKEEMKSFKIYYEAEIKILKAKFDKARPIIVEKHVSDCKSDKCPVSDSNSENEKILLDYINN